MLQLQALRQILGIISVIRHVNVHVSHMRMRSVLLLTAMSAMPAFEQRL